MHKCNISKSLTDWQNKKNRKIKLLSPHEKYWAEYLGIISKSLNLIFEFFPIERTKGDWRKGHLAQIPFNEELKFLLAMKTYKILLAEIKNAKKKASSCNIRKKSQNKWEREISIKTTNSYEERDTMEANAQM